MFDVNRLNLVSLVKKSLILSLLCLAATVNAYDHKMNNDEKMSVEKAWARALPPVVPNGAAYFIVTNLTAKTDVLESVSSDIAKRSMMHESYVEDGSVAMRHVDGITLNKNQSVEFKPGGYHIMLMGLKRPLKEGTTFELTLHFKHADDVVTQVKVSKEAIKEDASHQHHH